jgi:hypothetical protein
LVRRIQYFILLRSELGGVEVHFDKDSAIPQVGGNRVLGASTLQEAEYRSVKSHDGYPGSGEILMKSFHARRDALDISDMR